MTSEGFDLLRGARHVFDQRRVVAALLDTAGRTLWRSWRGRPTVRQEPWEGSLDLPRRLRWAKPSSVHAAPPPPLPGPELTERVNAPSPALIRAYARHLGMAAESGRPPAAAPAHLFPQWTFPIAARALRQVPYPLARILNAGCRLQINARVPASAPLVVRAQLLDVQDDGRRALLHQRVTTDTPETPGALIADLYAVAPAGTGAGRERRAPSGGDQARVPQAARELARVRFGPRAGLAYALVSGDFNPVHWAPAYARALGFPTPILHGFALWARTIECLGRALFAGAADRLRVVDVRFKRPLVLGRGVEVGVYLDDTDRHSFYVADAPGVRPYLAGSFEANPHA